MIIFLVTQAVQCLSFTNHSIEIMYVKILVKYVLGSHNIGARSKIAVGICDSDGFWSNITAVKSCAKLANDRDTSII
jgi:hypothetical protein